MQTRTHAEKSDTEPTDDQHTLDLFARTTDGAALPEITPFADSNHNNWTRGRCDGCGRTGPMDLDGEFVILHERSCQHAEDEDR